MPIVYVFFLKVLCRSKLCLTLCLFVHFSMDFMKEELFDDAIEVLTTIIDDLSEEVNISVEVK